jgi:hypothetical protein
LLVPEVIIQVQAVKQESISTGVFKGLFKFFILLPIAVLGVLLFIAGFGISITSCNEEEAKTLTEQAEHEMRSGQLTTAAQLLNKIVNDHPDSAQGKVVLYLRRSLREKEGDTERPLDEGEAKRLADLMVLLERKGVGTGVKDLAVSLANLHEAREKYRQENR